MLERPRAMSVRWLRPGGGQVWRLELACADDTTGGWMVTLRLCRWCGWVAVLLGVSEVGDPLACEIPRGAVGGRVKLVRLGRDGCGGLSAMRLRPGDRCWLERPATGELVVPYSRVVSATRLPGAAG